MHENLTYLNKLDVYFIDESKKIHKIAISMSKGFIDCPDGFLGAYSKELFATMETGFRNIKILNKPENKNKDIVETTQAEIDNI